MVITNNGLNSNRNNWSGDAQTYPQRIQLGNGTTTPAQTDTQLSGSPTTTGSETTIDTYNKDAIGSVTCTKTLGVSEANDTHTEVVLTTDPETSSTLTSDPTNVANSVCTDTTLSLTTNEWIDKRVKLNDGATDYYYTVVSNTANTFTIDGNAYSDGIRNGDSYVIDTVLAHNLLPSFTKTTNFMMRLEYRVPYSNV